MYSISIDKLIQPEVLLYLESILKILNKNISLIKLNYLEIMKKNEKRSNLFFWIINFSKDNSVSENSFFRLIFMRIIDFSN